MITDRGNVMGVAEPTYHDVRINYYHGGPGRRPECLTCGWAGLVSYDGGIQARFDAAPHSAVQVEDDADVV